MAAPASFANRTVIVTGAAGSIGRPLSIALAKAGANLVVNDLGGSPTGDGASVTAATALANEIRTLGYTNVVEDFHSVTEGAKIVAAAVEAFGSIDVIINNAGIIRYATFEECEIDDFRKTLEVNALGPISLIKAAWDLFKLQKYGRVVNFTSDSIFGAADMSPYIVSKGAVIGATKALAAEGAVHGIQVNAVGPTSFSRMAGGTIEDVDQRNMFQVAFPGEGNVPMILALAHESNTFNGEVFTLGGSCVGRLALGTVKGVSGVMTMEDCVDKREAIKAANVPVYFPSSIWDLMAWKGQQYS